MQEEDFERELKVLVLGNGAVGKTSIIRRFCKGSFSDESKKTIGVDFLERSMSVDSLGQDVRFMLWDTAGQDEFDSIVRNYFKGAGAAVLTFSTTDRESFDAIKKWKSRVEAECGDIAIVLVQNKIDLIDQATASAQEVEALARQLGTKLFRSSAKENLNIVDVFVYLAELHQRKLSAGHLGQPVVTNLADDGGVSTPHSGQSAQDNHMFGGNEQVGGHEYNTRHIVPSKQRTSGKKSMKDKVKDALFSKVSLFKKS